MSDFQKLIEVLSHQQPEGIQTGDWTKIEFWPRIEPDGRKIVSVTSEQVGFSFDKDGNLQGIFNWKD
jgi:hypothetical protein